MNHLWPTITLYQPWATWIMRKWKTIETRTHSNFASLKGKRILVHAGMKVDRSEAVAKNPYLSWDQICYDPEEIVKGYILGDAYVYDFKKLDESHSKEALIDCGSIARWGLFLTDIIRFDNPIPAKGQMGIWYFDLESKEVENFYEKINSQLNIF